jgi:Secretion system C-terminal sorting domain
MKQFTNWMITVLVCCTVLQNLKAQPTPPSGKKWVPIAILSEEFNGTGLDGNKWIPKHPYWNGREPSQFVPANVSVSGGNLRLKSTVKNANQQGNWVNSACVTSKTKAMKKGYYSEARIKCSNISMTTAFWFQGKYSEIDVIENFGKPTGANYLGHNAHMKTNTHYFPNGWASDRNTPYDRTGLSPTVGNAYYTYGVWWKDSRTMVFYLNGKVVKTTTTAGNFDEDQYMFFDTEVFSWGIGLPTVASLNDNSKNTGLIDWVHTFRLDNATSRKEATTATAKTTDNIKSQVQISPNPTKDFVTFTGLTIGDDIEISSVSGVSVYKSNAKLTEETITTSFLESGLYFVSIAGKTKLKLVKE